MPKTKENKGITLIALIITIVVLLILAGVTINAISGSESAPAKANEAGQKNDIGSAKDDISLTVANAKMQGMENAYVENGVSNGDAQNVVGTTVIESVEQKYSTSNQIGKATIDVDVPKTNNVISDDATILITTTDFEIEGTITLNDGVLIWGEIEPNVPRIIGLPSTLDVGTGTTTPINVRLKGTTGNINWSSSDSTIAKYENGTIIVCDNLSSSTATATITASAENCESKTCTITIRKMLENAIDLGTDINNSGVTTDDWVLLYDGTNSADSTIGGYVYCILADYLPNTYKAQSTDENSVIVNAGLMPVSGSLHSAIIRQNTNIGGAMLVRALNHSTAWTPLISSTYSSIDGVKVSGSITKEEMEKINNVNNKSYLPQSIGKNGFYYYWLASCLLNTYVYHVDYRGDIGTSNYYSQSVGVCPVVKIPSSAITLNKVNNVWKISVNT